MNSYLHLEDSDWVNITNDFLWHHHCACLVIIIIEDDSTDDEHVKPHFEWYRIDESDAEAVVTLRQEVETLIETSPYASMTHDLRWLQRQTDGKDKRLSIFVLRKDDVIVGYAPFFVHPSALTFSLGEISLFSRPINRHDLDATPLILETATAGMSEFLIVELMRMIRAEMDDNSAVFVQGAPMGTKLFKLLGERSPIHDFYCVVPHGPIYQRRIAVLEGDLDTYLNKLGKRSRRDLRRTRRNFVAHVDGNYRVDRFKGAEEVDRFVADAGSVSRKTYQWRLLGMGLRPSDALRSRLTSFARLGWFHGYILYAADKPIAFELGYKYGDTYYAIEAGYDPDWSKLQVGIFLYTEIVRNLLRGAVGVVKLDFLFGDDLYKKRLSNTSRTERHYYLIPKTAKGVVLAYSLIAVNVLSNALGGASKRLKVKDRIRRVIRRASTR